MKANRSTGKGFGILGTHLNDDIFFFDNLFLRDVPGDLYILLLGIPFKVLSNICDLQRKLNLGRAFRTCHCRIDFRRRFYNTNKLSLKRSLLNHDVAFPSDLNIVKRQRLRVLT